MLLTETDLIFRGVKPLLRLGAGAKGLTFSNPFAGMTLRQRIAGMVLTPRIPDRLRVVPPDAWPGDAQRGRDMVAGAFRFAGQTLEKDHLSWEPETAHPEWIAALHGFEWLRDLRSVGGGKARRMAREMVAIWIEQYPKFHETAWRADIMGLRLTSWIAFYDFFCASADDAFRKSYFSSLAFQARHLSRALPGSRTGIPLMKALRGLAYAGLALEGEEDLLEQAFRIILKQIPRQVLSDGAHISRNPKATFEFLQCLVDLRTALISAKMEMPEELQYAIDRITPAVKFFRHGDGALAQFNGGQECNAHLCEITLMHSGARGKAMQSLPQCGYERVTQGRSSIIMDTGAPLVAAYTGSAHAGPLGFEYSFGRDRVIVNCGSSEVKGKWRRVLRSTLAHSTLVVDNRNSCQFDEAGMLSGRPDVRSRRQEDTEVALIEASHDGYMPRFGLTYRRRVELREFGDVVQGEEHLTGRAGVPFAVRFHLHPDIHVSLAQGGEEAVICAASGTSWRLKAEGVKIDIEESVYVSEDEHPRPSFQIVLSGQTGNAATAVLWEMRREKI
jgi:uncharacterized heparinase superfamily protein